MAGGEGTLKDGRLATHTVALLSGLLSGLLSDLLLLCREVPRSLRLVHGDRLLLRLSQHSVDVFRHGLLCRVHRILLFTPHEVHLPRPSQRPSHTMWRGRSAENVQGTSHLFPGVDHVKQCKRSRKQRGRTSAASERLTDQSQTARYRALVGH